MGRCPSFPERPCVHSLAVSSLGPRGAGSAESRLPGAGLVRPAAPRPGLLGKLCGLANTSRPVEDVGFVSSKYFSYTTNRSFRQSLDTLPQPGHLPDDSSVLPAPRPKPGQHLTTFSYCQQIPVSPFRKQPRGEHSSPRPGSPLTTAEPLLLLPASRWPPRPHLGPAASVTFLKAASGLLFTGLALFIDFL